MQLQRILLACSTGLLMLASFLPSRAAEKKNPPQARAALAPRTSTLAHTYVVTDPQKLPAMPLPGGGFALVFLNGIYQTAGVDYTLSSANTVSVKTTLAAGDRVTLVGLGLAPQ